MGGRVGERWGRIEAWPKSYSNLGGMQAHSGLESLTCCTTAPSSVVYFKLKFICHKATQLEYLSII